MMLLFAFTLMSFIAGAQSEDNVFQDVTEVMKSAAESEMNILMVFGGSDWCRPCIQYKKEILESDEFLAFSKDNLAILYLDFPAKKKNKLSAEQTAHNEFLAKKYNPAGIFPKILIFDPYENILGEIKYTNQLPKDFISQCQNLLNQ